MEGKSWLKKYWWIIVIIIVVLFGLSYFGTLSPSMYRAASSELRGDYSIGSSEKLYPSSNQDFAPEIQERQLIKTSSISMETKRGDYDRVQSDVNNILQASGAYILSENFQILGTGRQTYKTNNYQIKIETSKYDSVVAQLQELGGITAFKETSTDVTGAIYNRQVEIAAEKERLRRYEQLLNTYGNLNDKITLTDRIFEQDRRIKYLEAGLQNTQQDTAYSTISLRLQEKAPALFGLKMASFGNLIKTLLGSLNALLYFIFAVLPWVVGAGVVYLVIRLIKKKKKRDNSKNNDKNK